ncbi:hypothetical protein, variant 1 [Fonticula alba]|uniref:Uncharacterized protein n=1 Tax=Fonticula alba TaxID=691883 RepID=A0A058Z2Y6_FONAL|nr:hypothetical protein, variant 1 [Fonticula alba]KCV68620.1 hypothetical protein, variant 1 [Fonticula alba]|eukprot:XP_009497052.1 hypothetical protein, variant 1 [Fonticula alba]
MASREAVPSFSPAGDLLVREIFLSTSLESALQTQAAVAGRAIQRGATLCLLCGAESNGKKASARGRTGMAAVAAATDPAPWDRGAGLGRDLLLGVDPLSDDSPLADVFVESLAADDSNAGHSQANSVGTSSGTSSPAGGRFESRPESAFTVAPGSVPVSEAFGRAQALGLGLEAGTLVPGYLVSSGAACSTSAPQSLYVDVACTGDSLYLVESQLPSTRQLATLASSGAFLLAEELTSVQVTRSHDLLQRLLGSLLRVVDALHQSDIAGLESALAPSSIFLDQMGNPVLSSGLLTTILRGLVADSQLVSGFCPPPENAPYLSGVSSSMHGQPVCLVPGCPGPLWRPANLVRRASDIWHVAAVVLWCAGRCLGLAECTDGSLADPRSALDALGAQVAVAEATTPAATWWRTLLNILEMCISSDYAIRPTCEEILLGMDFAHLQGAFSPDDGVPLFGVGLFCESDQYLPSAAASRSASPIGDRPASPDPGPLPASTSGSFARWPPVDLPDVESGHGCGSLSRSASFSRDVLPSATATPSDSALSEPLFGRCSRWASGGSATACPVHNDAWVKSPGYAELCTIPLRGAYEAWLGDRPAGPVLFELVSRVAQKAPVVGDPCPGGEADLLSPLQSHPAISSDASNWLPGVFQFPDFFWANDGPEGSGPGSGLSPLADSPPVSGVRSPEDTPSAGGPVAGTCDSAGISRSGSVLSVAAVSLTCRQLDLSWGRLPENAADIDASNGTEGGTCAIASPAVPGAATASACSPASMASGSADTPTFGLQQRHGTIHLGSALVLACRLLGAACVEASHAALHRQGKSSLDEAYQAPECALLAAVAEAEFSRWAPMATRQDLAAIVSSDWLPGELGLSSGDTVSSPSIRETHLLHWALGFVAIVRLLSQPLSWRPDQAGHFQWLAAGPDAGNATAPSPEGQAGVELAADGSPARGTLPDPAIDGESARLLTGLSHFALSLLRSRSVAQLLVVGDTGRLRGLVRAAGTPRWLRARVWATLLPVFARPNFFPVDGVSFAGLLDQDPDECPPEPLSEMDRFRDELLPDDPAWERAYDALDSAAPSASDRQLALDLPRCQPSHSALSSRRTGRRRLARALKSWCLEPAAGQGSVYWQGLDSVAAPLVSLFLHRPHMAWHQLAGLVELSGLSRLLIEDGASNIRTWFTALARLHVYHSPLAASQGMEAGWASPNLWAVGGALTLFSQSLTSAEALSLWERVYISAPSMLAARSGGLFIACAAICRWAPILKTANFNDAVGLFASKSLLSPDVVLPGKQPPGNGITSSQVILSVAAEALRLWEVTPESLYKFAVVPDRPEAVDERKTGPGAFTWADPYEADPRAANSDGHRDPDHDAVPQISPRCASRLLAEGVARILDLRPAGAFRLSHIPGSRRVARPDASFQRLDVALPAGTPAAASSYLASYGLAAASRLQSMVPSVLSSSISTVTSVVSSTVTGAGIGGLRWPAAAAALSSSTPAEGTAPTASATAAPTQDLIHTIVVGPEAEVIEVRLSCSGVLRFPLPPPLLVAAWLSFLAPLPRAAVVA